MTLTTITPVVAPMANLLPRRITLIALFALELIEPVNIVFAAWSLKLRSLRRLPADFFVL